MEKHDGERCPSKKLRIIVEVIASLLILIAFLGPFFGPYAPFAVSIAAGASMFPNIRSGDMVFMVSTKLSPVMPGDIASYRIPIGYVVHRVIDIKGDKVIFKGDNNLEPDKEVDTSRVYFKVIWVIPRTVWVPVLAAASTTYGLLMFALSQRPPGYGYPKHISRALRCMWHTIQDKKEEEFLPLYGLLHLVLLSLAVTVITLHSISIPTVIQAKPNPAPQISTISYSADGVLEVRFKDKIPVLKALECTVSNVPVPCNVMEDRIIVDLTSAIINCPGQPCESKLHIALSPMTPYNLTLHYDLTAIISR